MGALLPLRSPGRLDLTASAYVCVCGKEISAEAADYDCTAASSMTWIQNKVLSLFVALNDETGRLSVHSFTSAINRIGAYAQMPALAVAR
jgi:hypothetical protein